MRLLEHQGKELFSSYGIPVPRSKLAHGTGDVVSAVEELGLPVVLKAQVLSGGRSKAGGVVLVRTKEQALSEAGRLFGSVIGGEPTRGLLVEEALEHSVEMYLSISLDRGRREFMALASSTGGVDVESLGGSQIPRIPIPLEGLASGSADGLGRELGLDGRTLAEFSGILMRLERLSREEECELAEINPLVIHSDGTLVALDSKVVIDDNALFRHPEFSELPPEGTPRSRGG